MKTLRKIVTVVGMSLLSTGIFANDFLKVNPVRMGGIQIGQHENGQSCLTLGYDTDGDGYEDTRFHYMIYTTPDGSIRTQLVSYAFDKNKDREFTEDEWFPYTQE